LNFELDKSAEAINGKNKGALHRKSKTQLYWKLQKIPHKNEIPLILFTHPQWLRGTETSLRFLLILEILTGIQNVFSPSQFLLIGYIPLINFRKMVLALKPNSACARKTELLLESSHPGMLSAELQRALKV